MKIRLVAIGAVLFLAILACGGSNTGQKIGESTSAGPTNTPGVTLYKAGDIIKLSDHTIVMNRGEVKTKILQANFTIENTGTSDLAVSSLLSFSAKSSDGTKLDLSFDCGSSLDGKVLSGDKLKGDICFTLAGKAPYRIYYEAGLFSSGAIVWEIP